ncbi:MAG: ATP-binding protein [Nitrospirae bacterium]|nr:ATP-binding protein [Nitrospirota bacterium]
MSVNSESLSVLLSASAVLMALFFFALYFPRLLKKKRLEAERIEMNTVMDAFTVLGGEIKSLKEQLIVKERLAALGEVAAGIAHEFRNPMGVIAGYARLLQKNGMDTDNRKEIVQAILNEIEEMNRVMEELLKFSKSEPINKSDFELVDFVRNVVRSMGDTEAEIKFMPCEPLTIKGDKTLLRQAVMNLLQNALQAGDRIRIDIEKADLSGREGVSIAIKDNGQGIPKTDINKIFLPFYTTKSSGSGIGLALVQKIALAHGGSTSVNSKEGKGSTFRLYLPLQ